MGKPPKIEVLPLFQWDNGTVGPTAIYSWTGPGVYTVTVVGTNCQSATAGGHVNVTVGGVLFQIYLPLVVRG